MLDVEGFILVGGRSSRMGTDKSLMQFDGQTSVERMAAELRSITPRISLVGTGRAGFDPDLRIIPDTHEQWGALGGIHAALGACVADWALIVACDLPFVTRDLCARLLTLSQLQSPDAVVPIQPDGRPQPLCALYRREPCQLEAEAFALALSNLRQVTSELGRVWLIVGAACMAAGVRGRSSCTS